MTKTDIVWHSAALKDLPPPPETEIVAGVTAAEAYEGWEAGFIGETNNRNMTILLIQSADAAVDQTVLGRQTAAKAQLLAVITTAGYANEVSDAMLTGITIAVLTAVAQVRGK